MSPPSAREFSDQLWEANRDIYEEILSPPFLKELVDGTLSQEAFYFYMIQDTHYLREFARALRVTAAKAPRADWAALLNTHSAETLEYEKQLHERVFRKYAISANQVARTQPSPEAFGYASFLVATAFSRPFSESLAALLPCYWIYREVGKELQKRGPENPIYQSWIEAYASPEYGKSVQAVLDIINKTAHSAQTADIESMKANFRRSARYEWMFWDSAYHRRSWPPAGPKNEQKSPFQGIQ